MPALTQNRRPKRAGHKMLTLTGERRQDLRRMMDLVNRPAHTGSVHHQVDKEKDHIRDQQNDEAVTQHPEQSRLPCRARAECPLQGANCRLLHSRRHCTQKSKDPTTPPESLV